MNHHFLGIGLVATLLMSDKKCKRGSVQGDGLESSPGALVAQRYFKISALGTITSWPPLKLAGGMLVGERECEQSYQYCLELILWLLLRSNLGEI